MKTRGSINVYEITHTQIKNVLNKITTAVAVAQYTTHHTQCASFIVDVIHIHAMMSSFVCDAIVALTAVLNTHITTIPIRTEAELHARTHTLTATKDLWNK